VKKTFLSADAYLRDIWRLAAAVRAGGWRPDLLVGLWRGGAPAAIAVHEFLKVSGWNVPHQPLKSVSYTGIAQSKGEVVFSGGEAVFGAVHPGDKVLVVDDVFDTGKTAAAVHAKMRRLGADLRLACVYWKPAMNTTELKPDYFARDLGDAWIVFPHELDGLTVEDIREKDDFLAGLLADVQQLSETEKEERK